MISKVFHYLEPMWTGHDEKVSIRRVLALVFSFNLIYNMSVTIHKMERGGSISDVAILLSLEAGLIAALLSLTTYSSIVKTKLEDENK